MDPEEDSTWINHSPAAHHDLSTVPQSPVPNIGTLPTTLVIWSYYITDLKILINTF